MLRLPVSSPTLAAGAIGLRPSYGLAARQRKIALLQRVGHVPAIVGYKLTEMARYRLADTGCVYRDVMRISLHPKMSTQKLAFRTPPLP